MRNIIPTNKNQALFKFSSPLLYCTVGMKMIWTVKLAKNMSKRRTPSWTGSNTTIRDNKPKKILLFFRLVSNSRHLLRMLRCYIGHYGSSMNNLVPDNNNVPIILITWPHTWLGNLSTTSTRATGIRSVDVLDIEHLHRMFLSKLVLPGIEPEASSNAHIVNSIPNWV